MAVLRRRNEKQFLADIPTLITEEGIDSKYFQIFGIPEELPTGKSSFIVGGSPFLKSGVKLKIEIIDSKGEVIYTEPVFGYRDGVNRRVSIEIYDSSQVGEAIFTLLGEIDPSKSDVPIPTEWQGVYNVKYTRRLSINPTLLNVEPIRFHKQPYVNVVPLTNAFKEYIQQPEETRILTAELVTSKTAGTSTQTTDVVTQEQSYPEEEQAEKAFDFMSLYNSAAFRQSSFSNFRMPFTFQSFSPPTGNANLIVSSGSLDDGMIGKNIIINDPQVDTNSPNIPTNYTIPSQYSSSILDITNDTTANLAKAFYVTGDDGSTKYPVNLSTNQVFTCSFSPIPTEQDSVINYFDLADIRLSRLRTFSGDVKYVRVFAISQGAQTEQQFDLLGEFPLESQELLFDYDNIKSGRTGFFFNQTKIDNYWDSYGGTRATTATGSYGLSQTGSFIRYAMDISGSNADLNQEIMAQTSHSFSLSKNVPYELSFKVYGSRTPKTTSTGDGNKARIDFLISGSDFKPNHEFGGNYGRRILSIDFDDSEDYPELRDLQSYDWNKTYLNGMFIPLTSGVAKLQIRASSGRWQVADVSLRPAADTNFSPEVARIFSEMPPSRNRPETVKFLLEFVNNDGKKADAVIISPDVVFPGANFAIQGDNNVLSGSMFISNAVGEGIEMAGVGSAFLRTIGWEGFTSASSGTGKGGFFLYSGSVLSDSPDDYMGAGLEIHDGRSGASERYFQFKTQHGASSESIFRVKTDDYLFGISGSGGVESYISGADGNLEVSSSNFAISNTGNVSMTGTVTATAGNIGDWTISSGDIVGSNITMDADGSRIYKTDSNGNLDGYYMDFTPGSNYYVRFGTDFAVSSSGTLIASGAKIEGVITASEGYIANWTIAPHTINKLTGGTYTGMSSTGDTRFFAGSANLTSGTGSAPFNVKADGKVTASAGHIGGWTIQSDQMRSPINAAGRSSITFESDNSRILIKDPSNANDIMRIGDISDGAAGNKWGIVQFDKTGTDFETDRLFSLGDRGNVISGWQLTTNQIRGIPDAGIGAANYADGETKLIIHSGGSIETSDFATGLKGWRISSLGNGTAEFENMRIRGTLRTTVFEKESVNVVGGQLMVANSTTMEPLKDVSGSILAGAASMSATDVTMSVANVSGFSNGEIIKSKKVDDTGFIVEYMLVTGSMRYTAVGSPYSESIRLADMGATDPDGLAGEVYVGRGYGQVNVVSSSIATVDTEIPITGTYGTQANIILDLGANSVVTQSILKINDERFKVVSASSGVGTTGNNQTIKVLRDFLATDPAVHTAGSTVYTVDTDAEFLFGLVSSAQTYNAGQVVVSTGKFDAAKDLSSGYLIMNANPNDTSTPYMDIVERTGSGVYDLQLRSRLGDLSGLSSGYLYGDEEPGFGLYTDNGYFRGSIQALTGSIHGILNIATTAGGIETGDKMMLGRNVSGSSDGVYINTNNYWYTNGAWKVGGPNNYLKLDNATDGNIEIKSQTFELDTTALELSSTEASMSLGTSNEVLIKGNSNSPYISLQPAVALASKAYAGTGVFLGVAGGSTPLLSAVGSGGHLKFNGTSLDINTDTFVINTTTFDVDTDDGGTIKLGASPSLSANGIFLSGSGEFNLQKDSSNYIRFTGPAGLDIKTSALNISSSNIEVSTRAGGVIRMGRSGSYGAPVDMTNDGIFMSGSGEFSFQTGSTYIKSQGGSLTMQSSNFALRSDGTISASDAVFGGTVYATAGQIGTADNYWEISDEILQDKEEIIKLNSTDQNITLSTGAFFARIQNDMTPFTNLAGGAGVSAAKTVSAASSASYMLSAGEIASAATNTSDSSTWDDPLYMYSTGGNNIATALTGSTVDGSTNFTTNKTYTVVVGIRANFDHALSTDTSDFAYSVQGLAQATYTLAMYDSSDTLLKSWGARTNQALFSSEMGSQNTQQSITSTFTGTVTIGSNDEVYFKVTDATLTTTCQTKREWLTLPKEDEYYDITTKAQISGYKVNLTPSSNVVEVTPKGIQGVFVSDDTLETSPNAFFVLSGSTDQTMRIQGVSQFTGSLSVKHRGDLSSPNTVNISPGTSYADISAKNYNVQTDGAIYLKPSSGNTAIFNVLTGSIDCIGFRTGGGGTDFQMGDSVEDGNFHADANIIAYSTTVASDIRLKDNIQPLNNNLDKVLQLSPSSFTWKVRDKQDDIGLIAQAVEVVIPEIVSDHDSIGKTKEFLSGDTHKTVDYAKLTTILIGAIQEQQTQIENLDKFAHEPQNYKEKCDEMEKRIIELEKKLEEL